MSKILIGNKCDLEEKRVVSLDDAKTLANEYSMDYLETSAAEEVNIDNAFRKMAKMILERMSKGLSNQTGDGVIKNLLDKKQQSGNKSKCC